MRGYDIATEQIILATILQDNLLCSRAISWLKPIHFFGKRNRVIFTAIIRCVSEGIIPSPANIAARTDGRDFGGLDYLKKLHSADITDSLESSVDKLRKNAARRLAVYDLQDVIELAEDRGADYADILRAVNEARQVLFDAPLHAVKQSGSVQRWIDKYRKMRAGKFDNFQSTGYEPLDETLSEGFSPGSMTVIAGRTRMGKTMFIIDMIIRLLELTKMKILAIALEKGPEYYMNLLISRKTGIDKKRILKRAESLTDEENNNVEEAFSWLQNGRLTLPDNLVQGLIARGKRWTNEAAIEQMRELIFGGDYDLVIWDIWQRAMSRIKSDDITFSLAAYCEINSAAKTHSIIVQQLRRSAEDRTKDRRRRPTLNDLKQSGAYEEFSDAVLLIHREKVLKPRSAKPDIMEVTVAKQKMGVDGITMLADFQPETCTLSNPRIGNMIGASPEFIKEKDDDLPELRQTEAELGKKSCTDDRA